ncbi:translation initiation factor IF-2 [Candidatus Aerophobetes bacterium]|uniref:Translation initiation factor IF-2 n=1 Tax=Aerophobetes bacterium TaxID=2030807 RepID=A0A523Y405_UNCAE|nr:MAG: translation initiation factor IF-2 [Candidatus Aerophobetes bacterium]
MRIYQLARKLNLSNQELLKVLSQLKIKGKTSVSGLSAQEIKRVEGKLVKKKPSPKEKGLIPRTPVVTLLGHVDHGKTSLLDAVRKTNVAGGEVGGITQKIGASEVECKGKKIVFIDTPGHEAFTNMRAHGAQVTDIAVLVVAGDDGVMPQTIEAINHARAAKVPIMVAINKIDKAETKLERVREQLSKYDLVPEKWGGETIFVEVSALKGQGLDEFLEMILLEAEMLELKAEPEGDFQGVVIEGELDRQRGPCITLLVQKGTLEIGDILVGGSTYGRVRTLINWKGETVKKAGPSMPVRVLGLSDVSMPGDTFRKVKNEKEARQIAESIKEKEREKGLIKRDIFTLESLSQPEEEQKTMNIIVKVDTQGSLRAISDTIKNLESEEVKIDILHAGVGEVQKSDILLASASQAIIINFNTVASSANRDLAKEEGVNIRNYQVIYGMIDDIKKMREGLIEPRYEEKEVGEAQVREVFSIPKAGKIAGSYVSEGKMTRGSKVKVFRGEEVIGEGVIGSLKRFNRNASEVLTGLECGINIDGFSNIEKGDLIKAYESIRVE